MADIFLSIVVSQHGLPEGITSDHDPRFHGHFWDELMSLVDTILIFSMASHLQTDRVAGVTNYNME